MNMLSKYEIGDDFGPNDCDMYTAGIRIGNHGNAIECHGSTLKEAQARRDTVLLGLSNSLPMLVRAYNSGYMCGHHDTVEGGFTDIHYRDVWTYHTDVVEDMLADGTFKK